MNLNELAKQCHEQAKKSKFYQNDEKFLYNVKMVFEMPEGFIDYIQSLRICQLLLLAISELTEAMEADRKDNYCKLDDNYISDILLKYGNELFLEIYNFNIKDTFENEIAGALIRIFDLCGFLNIDIDIDGHMKAAMRYNSMREVKHGKKY